MKQLVEINLTTRTVKNWQPPEIRWGESLTLALRYHRTAGKDEIPTYLTDTTLKAGIGREDARPDGGTFALKIGLEAASDHNTTAPIACNALANELRDALNAPEATTAYGVARVVAADGSWLIFFGDQSQRVPLDVVDNALWPISRVRLGAWQVDGKWVHEVRLTQAPVAFTSNHEVTLPPAPTVTRIIEGGCDPANVTCWNEVQQIYIPAEFIGAYIIKLGYGKTIELSRDDGIEKIKAALQAIGADCFRVTLPLTDHISIEFIGDYAEQPMELLGIEVTQAPPGDDTFTILFDRAELASLLRRESPVTVPFQIFVTGTDEHGSRDEICAVSLPVTLSWPLIFPELESVPSIDLLRPHSPKSYMPFGEHNILTGQRYYTENVGGASEFVIAHGLDTEAVFVFARENISGGQQLVYGEDFTATIDSANQVTITPTVVPEPDAWTVIVLGAQSVAAWANGLTVTVPQVVAGNGYPSLAAFMDDIGERVEVLETILPSTGPAAQTEQASGIEILLPETKAVLFYRGDAAALFDETTGLKTASLRYPPVMYPAIHMATPTDYASGPLPDAAPGTVWKNTTGATLSFGSGVHGGNVPQNGFFGSDGRGLYGVQKSGETKSYFPTGFNLELWRIFINDKMLRLRRTLDVQFALALQLAKATSNAQWQLVIEHGTAPSESTPSPTDTNLENVIWNATPLLSQRLILTGNRQTHSVGTRIKRSLVSLADTITADTMLYGVWEGANELAPATANFALRARLVNFDTENALQADARGWIAYELLGAGDGGKPKAIIT